MFSFSWVIGSGENAQGGNTNDVQLESVLETVDLILEKSGSVTLDIVDGDQMAQKAYRWKLTGVSQLFRLGKIPAMIILFEPLQIRVDWPTMKQSLFLAMSGIQG